MQALSREYLETGRREWTLEHWPHSGHVVEEWLLEHKLLICCADSEALDSVWRTGLNGKRILERNRESAESAQIAIRGWPAIW
jgi:hypothetical protein